MKWISTIFLAVVVNSLITVEAQAANTVTFADGSPFSSQPGVITATGTFSTDAGWQVTSMVMYATNRFGGEGGEANCTTSGSDWGAVIGGLPAATYDVFVRMIVVNTSTNQVQYIDTCTKQVCVAGP